MLPLFNAPLNPGQSGIQAAHLCCRVAALILGALLSPGLLADTRISRDTEEIELTNFAFANYLGSGLYSSGDQKLFIFRVSLSSDLIEGSAEKSGLVLHYPISLGVAMIEDDIFISEIGDVINVNNLVTLSVVPGLEYVMPVAKIWKLAPFADLGLAKDYNNNTTVAVGGIGVKSYVNLKFADSRLLIANRLLYARQENLDSGSYSHFNSLESGLEYTIPADFNFKGTPLDFTIYYINYYYLDDIVLGNTVENRISLQNKNEAGFTFTLPKREWLPDDFRLGFGVQVTRDTDFYRIVFGSPFF